MSTTIDERIVKMTFENKNFESGISSSLKWLEKLNSSLKLKNGTNGLNEVERGINKLSSSGLSGLSRSIDTISSRFSALGVVGATALVNITNSALNAGKNLANALTFEPIFSGFQEYETKMNSIQTILTNTASKGTTMSDVTKALEELNKYADLTIYNFAEMTKNIGTFTAAGIDLDTSVKAIKGISNLAAGSGSTPQQAASAMYQLSQALAAGKVSLQDWNSVVNAGMGGELFQQALIKTAKAMGKNVDQSKAFRETLQDGWLTSEVLIKTLEGFAMDESLTKAATEVKTLTGLLDTMKESVQSGWAVSWEYILGDKEEAAQLFTAISEGFNNIIGPSSDARNEMLKFWNDAGGRADVIEGLSNIINSLGKGLGAVGKAFREVFPAMTGQQLVDISAKFKDLTEKFKMSDSTAGKIKSTFKGVFSIINLLKNGIVALVSTLNPLAGIFTGIGSVLLNVTSGIGGFISSINTAANETKFFDKVANSISNIFKSFGSALDYVNNLISQVFSGMGKLDFSAVFEPLGDIASILSSGISGVLGGIGKALGSINFDTIFKAINTALAGGALVLLKDFIKSIDGVTSDLSSTFDTIKGAFGSITDTLDAVKESLMAYQNNLNAGTLLKISSAIALLAGALLILSTIDEANLDSALTGITVLFIELIAAMGVLMKISAGTKFKGFLQVPTMFIILSTSILILASAVKKLSGLSWEELAKGLAGVTSLVAVFIATSKLMNGGSKGLVKMATSLLILSVAVNSLARAVGNMGNLNTDQLIKGLGGIGTLLAELAIFSKLNNVNNVGLKNSAGILLLATALNVLAIAVDTLGRMDTGQLVQGLSGIGAVLAQLSIFAKVSGKSGNLIAISTGLLILGVSLNVLSGAVKSMGSMSWDTMGKGLTAMASALVIIATAARLIPKGLIVSAVGIGVMAGSLLILSTALASLGGQSWEQVAVSLVSLAGALTIIAVAMNFMTTGLVGAAAMLVMSAALALFIPQLMLLSSLSLEQVGIGLLALAGAFGVLGLAGLVLTPVIPTLVALAGVIALFGLSTLAVAGSMSLFAGSLALLATVGTAGGLAFVEVLRQMINLLPQFGKKLGEAFVSFAEAIGNNMPTLITAVGNMISGIIQGFAIAIPKITSAAVELITALLSALSEAIPKLLEIGVDIVIKVLEGITTNAYRLVTAGVELIVAFLDGISANLGTVISAGINLAISFINGVANGLRNNGPALSAALSNLISALIETAIGLFMGSVGTFISCGVKLISSLLQGISSTVSSVISFVGTIPGKMASAISQKVSSMVNTGKNLIRGLTQGIKSAASGVVKAAQGVVSNAIDAARNLLGIHSPSRVFAEIGKYTSLGLAVGLTKFRDVVTKPAENLAQTAIDAVSNPMSKIADILSSDIDSNPTIKPVLDLSNIKSGSRTITDLLSKGDKLSLDTDTSGVITRTIGKIQNGVDNSDVVKAIKDLKGTLTNTPNNSYSINGITYDDGSNISSAIKTLVHATTIERRV